MKNTKPGMKEFQIYSLFNWYCSWNGCTGIPYNPICGSGKNSAILHYHSNDKELKDGDFILNDMGCRENMYCSDITNTYPINGKFSQKQKEIYNIVLEVQNVMLNAVKPGATYKDVDTPGRLHMVRSLAKLGFYNLPENESDYPEGPPHLDYLESNKEKMLFRLSQAVCPHGWGHFIGLYTHDVGHFNYDEVQKKMVHTSGYKHPYEKNMCVTVEPGIYFIPVWLDQIKIDKKDDPIISFFNFEKFDEYKEVGGVRIEDVVLVTADGAERLSSLPRSVEEIEKIMSED